MQPRVITVAGILLCLIIPTISQSQIPRTLSYQGVLTDNAGKPRPDGSYSFTFRLYTSPTGGTAIWSESRSLSVKSGLFSTELGKETPFAAAVKFETQYWLGIQVGNDPELSPRIALTSVGYSFSALRADTAKIAMAALPSSSDTTWRASGGNVYLLNGNVGIGTTSPGARLDVAGDIRLGDAVRDADVSLDMTRGGGAGRQGGGRVIVRHSEQAPYSGSVTIEPYWYNGSVYEYKRNVLVVDATGKVGIGTTNPTAELHVHSDNPLTTTLRVGNTEIYGNEINRNINDNLYVGYRGTANTILQANGGNVGIGTGTTSPTAKLEVAGRTKTNVLEITGGMDLAEPFEISESQPIPKGALVIIDEENPGQLKLSHQAYDKRVAGVVSGAGGINPGLTLTQESMLEGGQNVALSGRVYALATADNGPIKPGDRLTTSALPGHSMKATDSSLCDGAVIGKAMSSLETGEGFVLVLVNLQ